MVPPPFNETPDPANPRPSVLWIGPPMRPLHEEVGRFARVVRASSPVAALATTEALPEATAVLACPRPIADPRRFGELIDRLGTDRVVQLLGVWCEGEGRTGHVLDGVQRVFWHEWPRWVERRFGSGDPLSPARSGPEVSLVVESPDKALVDAIADELADGDLAVQWSRPGRSANALRRRGDILLFDAAQLGGHEAARLADACARARRVGATVVVLLDFPRPESLEAARAIGASAALAKPFDRQDLIRAIGAWHPPASALREVA